MLALDGIRGTAALCVAVLHYQEYFSRNHHFFQWAWTCVDLFFLISGVVMMHVYEKRIEERSITFPVYLSHRIARLWPAHFFAMLVMLELEFTLQFLAGGFHTMDWKAPAYTFLLNLFFLQHIGLYDYPTWDGNAWSLTPEIVANLIWFYLVTTRRLSSKLIVVVILCFSVIQYNMTGTINGLILNSYLVRCGISYGIGCLLYRHFIANPALGAPSRLWCEVSTAGLFGVIILAIIDLFHWQLQLWADWDWMLVLFVFPTFTYLALQPRTTLNTILSSRIFVFLGTISYCVYLYHVQVALLLNNWCIRRHTPIDPPYKGIIYLVFTIVLATIVWRAIEIPSRRALRDRLAPYLAKIFFDRY